MRPSWQIDLKWAAGLLACLFVVATGVLFSLDHLTARDTAVPLSTAVLEVGISDRVSDADYAQVQAGAVANPDATVSLAPLSVTATGREIAGLSKDDAAKLMAGKLAAVIYDKGGDAARALIVQKLPNSDKSPLSLGSAGSLSSDNHSMFSKYFLVAAALSVLLLAVVTGMSRGFGRLGAPAFVVALGTAPLAALWAIAGPAIGTGDPNGNAAMFAARAAAHSAANDLSSTFVLVAAIASATAILAPLGRIALVAFKRVRARSAPTPAPAVASSEVVSPPDMRN
jgi:hypothetical protein